MSDTDRTDIIPGLRPSDTAPEDLLLPMGQHQIPHGGMPRLALFAVWAGPVVVVAFLVGRFVLPGLFFGDDPAATVQVSPSSTASEPSSLEPVAPLPVRSRSRADRSRPRSPRPPAPSASRRSSSPAPMPTPTPTSSTPRTAPRPASPSPTRTGSSGSPTPTPTDTSIPTPEVTG